MCVFIPAVPLTDLFLGQRVQPRHRAQGLVMAIREALPAVI
jgi:hypothetical protein